ncbi:MAG: hypothetical protein DRI30_02910, partial [Chloroflexi bacterium]
MSTSPGTWRRPSPSNSGRGCPHFAPVRPLSSPAAGCTIRRGYPLPQFNLATVRRRLEDREASLSPHAARSASGRGRAVAEEPSPVRTEFQRDRDRIIHSKAFRRLKHKTQVFIAPVGDHFATRLTHTLAVAQIARTITRALHLNAAPAAAIALAHDIGHP